MNCEFEKFGEKLKCVHCGIIRNVKTLRTCAKRPGTLLLPPEPGKVRQVSNYATKVAKWKLAGSPSRTPEEIAAVLEICQGSASNAPCPMFIPDGRPRCRLCGCSINNRPNGLTNLIAMATESCPDKPPKWEEHARPPTLPPAIESDRLSGGQ